MDRLFSVLLRLSVALVVGTKCLTVVAEGAELDPEVLRTTSRAMVFIRAERLYQGTTVPTSGSGFFIHEEGYALTNWHVVADQVLTYVKGKEREIPAKVVKLEAVIGSGTAEERVVPVDIIATDRGTDLALLKVRYRPAAVIDTSTIADVQLTDQIWVVGFPFGDLLAMENWTAPTTLANPEPSINAGMVTSLRRDGKGILRAIQTDAAVNPGNSGGPLLDAQGRLAGVVNLAIVGGQGVGFAISPNLVREFIAAKAAKVSFDPGMVLSPPEPIRVTVAPILARLDGTTGSVRLTGDDIPPVEVALVRQGKEWIATLVLPERVAGLPIPQSYLAEVAFVGGDGSVALNRRHRLETFNPSHVPGVATAREPERVMEDRQLFANEGSISDFTKSGEVGGKSTRSLSDYAKSAKIKRSENGTVVIDDEALFRLTDPLEHNFPEERYENILEGRALVKDFDIKNWVFQQSQRYLPLVNEYLGDSDYRGDHAELRKYQRIFDKAIKELGPVLEFLRTEVTRRGLVLCRQGDTEKWYYRHAAPCEAPVQP